MKQRYAFLGYAKTIPVYDMSKKVTPARLNDQKPKPKLGNDSNLHGKTSVDNAGGANPPSVNPSKKKR